MEPNSVSDAPAQSIVAVIARMSRRRRTTARCGRLTARRPPVKRRTAARPEKNRTPTLDRCDFMYINSNRYTCARPDPGGLPCRRPPTTRRPRPAARTGPTPCSRRSGAIRRLMDDPAIPPPRCGRAASKIFDLEMTRMRHGRSVSGTEGRDRRRGRAGADDRPHSCPLPRMGRVAAEPRASYRLIVRAGDKLGYEHDTEAVPERCLGRRVGVPGPVPDADAGGRPAAGVLPAATCSTRLRYVVRTGCQWRFLPHDFPPWTAVYQQARRWVAAGVFEDDRPRPADDPAAGRRAGRPSRPARSSTAGPCNRPRRAGPGRVRRGQEEEGVEGPHRRGYARAICWP